MFKAQKPIDLDAIRTKVDILYLLTFGSVLKLLRFSCDTFLRRPFYYKNHTVADGNSEGQEMTLDKM